MKKAVSLLVFSLIFLGAAVLFGSSSTGMSMTDEQISTRELIIKPDDEDDNDSGIVLLGESGGIVIVPGDDSENDSGIVLLGEN